MIQFSKGGKSTVNPARELARLKELIPYCESLILTYKFRLRALKKRADKLEKELAQSNDL